MWAEISARAQIPHVITTLGGILACLDRAGTSPRLSGLKLFPYNRNYFLIELRPHQ